ncbi:MAG: hypothetical protein ACYC1M_09785 [Armatimonadota bacterium]
MATAAMAQTPFKVGIELPTMLPVDPAVELMLKDVGVNYLNFYTFNNGGPTEQDAMAVYDAQAALAKRLGAEYQLACHHMDIPEAVVRKAAQDPLCNGVLIDELEHIRLLWRLNPPPAKLLADVNSFTDLYDAHDKAVTGWKELGDKYRSWGIKNLNSTHVWPVLLSVAAEGGWNPTPKICKEYFSPVSLAIGMGAALQYDKQLMVDCDLWLWDMLPGHSAEEYRSNLLLAYWSGADGIYTEGSGYNLLPAGRQGLPHSLMQKISDTEYALSPHGEVLRWFIKEYIPAHPRPWSFCDIKPDVAIIRFDDSCYGQRYTGMPDTLYGSDKLHSDADTEAVFQMWNLLTASHTGRDGIVCAQRVTQNMYNYEHITQNTRRDSYLTRPVMANAHNFFVPLNNVVVFDDTVGAEKLRDIPCLVLSGKRISPKTWRAVQARVRQGAVCVIWAPLAVKLGLKPDGDVTELPMGKGKLVITTDFGFLPVFNAMWPYLGHGDQIRYRFTQGEVVLKQVDANKVDVITTVYP